MSLTELVKSPRSSAPGQYLGYALQPVRLCHYLLRVPDGFSVSLEHLDDVAVHDPQGRFKLEQTKSSLSGNPVSDKSEELWKTFGNWADLCQSNAIDPLQTEFLMFVTPVNTGTLVQALDAARTKEAALAIIATVKAWSTPSTAQEGCNPHVARFLAAGDEVSVQIILNFRLHCERDPLEGIREILRGTLPETSLDDFCSAAIGQAKETADKLLREHGKALIDAADYRRQFHAFVRKHNLAGLLNSTTGEPDVLVIRSTIDSAPTFVRQLDAIKLKPQLVIGAVSDYLRTKADKIKWAADGLIVDESFDEFDEGLERRFAIVRDEIEDLQASLDSEKRGRSLYRQCVNIQMPLEGRSLPSHFVSGAFNLLADSLRVGWHPDYTSLFEGN